MRRQVTPSTVVLPCHTASQKAALRRMAEGSAHYRANTLNPQRCSRRMVPVARSPAPRIRTQGRSALFCMVPSPFLYIIVTPAARLCNAAQEVPL